MRQFYAMLDLALESLNAKLEFFANFKAVFRIFYPSYCFTALYPFALFYPLLLLLTEVNVNARRCKAVFLIKLTTELRN